jgi:polar amino acid transport system substrate-binding protein
MRNSVLAAALALASAAAPAAESPGAGQSGPLRVAVYTEHAPFSDEGKGVDVEVGTALAAKLGLPAEIIPFKDGESVDDDLRNIVWKGHYLWKGKLADVMMHVPVDPDLARKNPQVRIVAPYFRERLVVARSKSRIPRLETFEVFTREKIGVQFNTIEDHYLLRSFGGILRDNVVHFLSVPEAAAALRRGDVAAIMGRRAQIEAALAEGGGDFAVSEPATPGLRPVAWDVGMAVKADDPQLAARIEAAVLDLRMDGSIQRIFAKRGMTYAAPAPAR